MPVTTGERRMRVAQQLRLVIRHFTRADVDLVNMPPAAQQTIRDFITQARTLAKQYDPSNERSA
jgi:hypothetical protein